MCGIVGKLNFDSTQPIDARLIRRMTNVIAHRGPDGEGDYVSGPVGLGHRRLSIIGVDSGAQPMPNEDGTVWVVYNGEIYNFPELRTELLSRGHVFKSNTDTEVIVHLYEEIGTKVVERLNGMFAFALWDERKRLLLLARDRVGIKPLYYVDTGKAIVFGSEIKSLLIDPSVERRVNLRAIDRFLTYYYLPGEETLFEGIVKLEPGTTLTIVNGRATTSRYWDLRFEESRRGTRFDAAVEELRNLLSRTVKDHMISDVPVGVLLSGGVDSTGVLRYAVEHASKPIQTFTVGFAGEGFADERPFAKLAADCYGTHHQDISINAHQFRDLLPTYVWHMEDPVCEPPALALFLVSQLARRAGVKVLLSGEGGDEAFGGYNKYKYLIALERLKAAFGPAKGLLRVGLETLRSTGWQRMGRYAGLIDRSLSEYYLSCTATPDTLFNRSKHVLYRSDFGEFVGAKASNEPTSRLFSTPADLPVLNQMLLVDTKTWLPNDLLIKADKMTMATSIELRVPLLDFQVLEFAASLPTHFKATPWSTKRILKATLSDSVPAAILNRKKAGFPVPYERWLRKELKEFVFETILSRNNSLRTYFRADALRDLLEAHQRGENGAQEIFSLLVLELFHQQFSSSRHLQMQSRCDENEDAILDRGSRTPLPLPAHQRI
jgi:asparagine synthase (glutamine-hydrolysing)